MRSIDRYGGIDEVFIMKDRETQESRGLAFVRFRDLAEGQNAIAALNGTTLPESARPLTVIYAQGEAERLGLTKETPGMRSEDTKLYVAGLGPSTEAVELRKIFEPFGRVTEVHVPGPHALYAFVRFAEEKDAMRAISDVNGRVQVEGSQRMLEVKVADPSSSRGPTRRPSGSLPPVSSYGSPAGNGYDHTPSVQPRFVNGMSQGYGQASTPLNSTMAGDTQGQCSRTIGAWTEYFAMDGTPYYHNSQSNTVQWELPMEFKNPSAAHTVPQAKGPAGANIFIFSVPDAWTEMDLRQHFGLFGNIVSAKVVVDKQTGISRGYGFISYDNCDSAERAVQTMDGYMAPTGRKIKVQIKKGEGSNNDASPKHATTPY
ncbi:CUG triplet repeat RNA-binding protein, putative [Perkinsus marinus ATCC 50983]|uniref:CUG triplet repeat RNA-binding protein, putative n=1 Tax=Perkinsus marinus (strain ATCC 50983 / TXsc) TaxID=423536 RepID=C5LVA7_PERM5|nr:CUG triplet repeat RNA-binding protein, putative [Perkinsus marinus ATCC 50983]EEQ99345.1 CUG triplet repeat RNA-binding protein, putative [Perkinsus marinus ATCC 50983]|eukprot:XP_002766628.1 CUG triplet repeat RNA-binding protein, putative [Perkinsus marinus ATCC 50983]